MEITPFSDYRATMSTNKLLQPCPVGHTAPSTYDLPPSSFRYGIRSQKNGSVKDCLSGWDDVPDYRPSPQTARATAGKFYGKQDYIATNKAALNYGCTTAREYTEFKNENRITVQPIQNHSAEKDLIRKKKVESMVHGIPTPLKSEIADCLTYRTLNDALERAETARTMKSARRKKSSKPSFSRAARSTKASRGHTQKPKPPPTEAETFKMKRFKAIDHCAIVDHW